MRENIIYKDLDLTLTQHPFTNDISPLVNSAAIKRSIRHLFLLNKYDIPFDNTIFSAVKNQLFEPISKITESNIISLATWLIETYEPRVKLLKVDVQTTQKEDGYELTIYFKINSTDLEDSTKIVLRRIR